MYIKKIIKGIYPRVNLLDGEQPPFHYRGRAIKKRHNEGGACIMGFIWFLHVTYPKHRGTDSHMYVLLCRISRETK